jgi:N-acyl-D-amino-acid deacylase
MRAAAFALLAFSVASAQPAEPVFDILITGGRVMDGTGNPARYADVAIQGRTIAAVGRLAGAKGKRIINAKGKVIVPGFIDLHSHADRGLTAQDRRRRSAPNLVSQGITTVLVNPDGAGPWPLSAQRAAIERLGVGPNVGLMVPHGTIRREVMKEDFRRAATAAEIRQMRNLVRQGMQDHAFGLSAGLEYVPAIWSTTEELIELVRELVPFGGSYVAHQRSESTDPRWFRPSADPAGQPTMLDAVNETITIGEQTGATVVWSHCKAMGAHYWGSSQAAIRLINRARSRGVDVWADQYPYNSTGGDGAAVLVPSWALGTDAYAAGRSRTSQVDYAAALRRTMADSKKAEQVRRDIMHETSRRGGPENVVVFEHPDPSFIGKSVDELARARGITPVQMALELQYEGFRDRPGGARLRGFSVWENDVEALMAQPWTATSTDAGIALPEDGPDVHARYYGSYPRKLRRYALERGVISVEHAVRSSTSLPAQILGINDRGLVRAGLVADLAVLDLESIRDRATFEQPHQHSEGVDYVLVNGRFVMDGAHPTGELPGTVLRPPGRAVVAPLK